MSLRNKQFAKPKKTWRQKITIQENKTCELATISNNELIEILELCNKLSAPGWDEPAIKRIQWLAHDLRFIIGGRISWSTYVELIEFVSLSVNQRLILSQLVCMHTAPLDMIETFLSTSTFRIEEQQYLRQRFQTFTTTNSKLCCEQPWIPQPIIHNGFTCAYTLDDMPHNVRQTETIAAVIRANNDGKLIGKCRAIEYIKDNVYGNSAKSVVLLLSYIDDFTEQEINDDIKVSLAKNVKVDYLHRLDAWQTHQKLTYYCDNNHDSWSIEDVWLFLRNERNESKSGRAITMDFILETIQSKMNTKTIPFADFLKLLERTMHFLQDFILFCLVDISSLNEVDQKNFTKIVHETCWHEKIHPDRRQWMFAKFQQIYNFSHFDVWLFLIQFPYSQMFASYEAIVDYATKMKQKNLSWSTFLQFSNIINTHDQMAVLFCLLDFATVSTTTILTFLKDYRLKSIQFYQFARTFYEKNIGPITPTPTIDELVKRTGISSLQYLFLDKLPQKSEYRCNREFINILKYTNFQSHVIQNLIPPQACMLPELWHLISSFLLGFTDHLVVSLPAKEVINLDYISFDRLRKKGISHFHGPENNVPYAIAPQNTNLTPVHGSCPFTTNQLKSFDLRQTVDGTPFDEDDRFLVGITMTSKKDRQRFASTWRENMNENVRFELTDHKNMLACKDSVFWHQNGKLRMVTPTFLPIKPTTTINNITENEEDQGGENNHDDSSDEEDYDDDDD